MSNIKDLMPVIQGELMEISISDEFEDLLMNDFTKKINGVIYGIVKNLLGDFVVVDCCYIDKTGSISFGNIIYINVWFIKMLTKVKSNGSLHDVMLSSAHTTKMKRLLKLDDKP